MSIYSLARFQSIPVSSKTLKFPILRYTSSSLPDQIYTCLQNNPINTESALNLIKPKLDAKCVNAVLDKCRSLNNTRAGLRFFVWAGNHSSYRHTDFMYSKASQLFSIKQNPQLVLDLFEVFKSEKCAVSIKSIKVLLNLCKQASLADEALLVLRKMPEFGLRPDVSAYGMVIRLFCVRGDMDKAHKLMEEMISVLIYPDMGTYISMIKGFCDLGRVEEASRLLKAMQNHGCVPNIVAYSVILNGVCKFGSVERALELLREMEKEGGIYTPNVITYTTVIQSLCEKGRPMDALLVLDRMEFRGCAPNRVTVSTLLKGLTACGHLEEAHKLIDRVVLGGSVSFGDCYSSLVVCLLSVRKIEEAEKLFRKMLGDRLKPDGLACSLMIKELCFSKGMLDGYRLHEEIENMGVLSTIDSDIYSILLAGLCQEGNSVEAIKLARSLLGEKLRLKHPYRKEILHHLKKLGEMELVNELSK